MLGVLKHPALIGLHGCTPFDSPSGPAILTPVMESSVQQYVELERCGSSPPCWTRTQKHIVLLGIAAGMSFMHSHRCIHRDLKPGNVLLDDRCEPRIADFGLSKSVERGESRNQSRICGTPSFMAPEIHSGKDFDFAVDVYAFGMIVFVVLAALEPFPDCRCEFLIAQRVIDGGRPKIPASVNRAYAELIEKCWAQDPRDRPDFEVILSFFEEDAMLEGLDVGAVKAYAARVLPS
jgi:serine/threonine protein kinase